MLLETAFHTQAKAKSYFHLSSLIGCKEHRHFAFCRFKSNLSALVVYQIHMGNGEIKKKQARITNKTYE